MKKCHMNSFQEHLKNSSQHNLIEHVLPQIEQNSLRVLTMIPAYSTAYPHCVPATNTNINVCKANIFIYNMCVCVWSNYLFSI